MKIRKVVKWGAIIVVLLIVAAVTIIYLRLNAIVEYAVETQGTKQLNLSTQLEGASVGLFGGELGLDDLKIANPQGFTAPHLFTLDGIEVKAPLRQLRDNPKRISSIVIDEPKLVIERGADGRFNFKAAMDNMPKGPTPTEPAPPQQPSGDEMRLIIDELTIKEATVLVRPGINLPGIAQEITVPIPTVTMKNIGNDASAQNGAAMRDVAQQVITVLAAQASNSELLPKELRGLLSLDVNAVVAEIGNRIGAEAQKRIAGAVGGELGAQLGNLVADPEALIKDPGKAIEGLGKKLPTSNPSDLLKDPGKAVEDLGGLFGGKKDKKENPKP